MANFSFTAFLAAAFVASHTVNAIELTGDNYVEMTAGKTVFIKFYAPWCGHCKAMANDWDTLTAAFEGHEVALIGEVDCTDTANDELCEAFNVEGFPTLMWGESSSPENYELGRDLQSLKAFADEFVTKPVCSVIKIDHCSEEEKAAITAAEAKTDEELQESAKAVGKLANAAEDEFDAAVNEIQEQYEKLSNEFSGAVEKIKKENNYKFIVQVMRKRKVKVPDFDGFDDEDKPDDDDDDDDDDMKDDDDDLDESAGEL